MKNDFTKLLKDTGTDIAVALVFLTRVPLKLPFQFDMKSLSTASAWFPLIGILVGVFGGLVYSISYNVGMGPLVAALLAISAQVLLTGALHEDAIADVADGFGGGTNKEAKLSIMRDSRIGAYGVLALILVVGIKVFVLARLEDPTLVTYALITAGAISRAGMTGVMYFLEPARDDGLGKDAGQPVVKSLYLAILLALLTATLLFGSKTGVVLFVSGCLGAAVIAWIAHRQIDGKTGDVLGACQQLAEFFCLIILVSLVF